MKTIILPRKEWYLSSDFCNGDDPVMMKVVYRPETQMDIDILVISVESDLATVPTDASEV